MTAAVIGQLGLPRPYARSLPLQLAEIDLDPPGPGELLVRIAAAGVCHSDLSVVDGTRPWPLPLALGHEAAGVVEAVGTGVADVAPGDHVVLVFLPSCGTCAQCTGGRVTMCPSAATANRAGELLRGGSRLRLDGAVVHHHLGVSAFAELAVVDRASAVVIADDIPLRTAALLGCAALTGTGAVLSTAGVRPGESLAVFGLGGVGLCAILGGVLAGAHPIVGVDPVPSKRELAVALGATQAMHPDEAEEAMSGLPGGGVDHAIEAVGHADVLAAAYRATARGGTTVAVGLPSAHAELTIPALSVVAEGRRLLGSYLGSSVPQRDVPRLVGLWRAGRLPLEQLTSSTAPLEAANAAMDALADGHVVRQVLLP